MQMRLRNQFIDRQLAALIQRSHQPEATDAERLSLLQQQQELRELKRKPIHTSYAALERPLFPR